MEAAVGRAMERKGCFQPSESDRGGIESAPERICGRIGLDRRAAHSTDDESGRVWWDVDGEHRGNRQGGWGKWGEVEFSFVCRPVERVNLARVAGEGRIAGRLGGEESGTLQVKTEGVGRDELLGKLTGRGEFHLNKVEFRGWDVNASVEDGVAHTGVSRWASGEGSVRLRDSSILLEDWRLDGEKQVTLVNGTRSFGRKADLAIETAGARKSKDRKASDSGTGHVLKISGPLDGPKVSVEKAGVRQPAD